MEILKEYLLELVWLDNAITKSFDDILNLSRESLYVSFDDFLLPSVYVIKLKQYDINKKVERKKELENFFRELERDTLYLLYEYIAKDFYCKNKIPILCCLFEMINQKEERMR